MNKLLKEKSKLESILLSQTSFLKGSINGVCAGCKRANCVCEKKSKDKVYRLTYKDRNQKTKIIYISRDRLGEAKEMINQHKKIKETLKIIFVTSRLHLNRVRLVFWRGIRHDQISNILYSDNQHVNYLAGNV